MKNPLGFGPVFRFEAMTAARRWQVFATRILFVSALLIGLWMIWAPEGIVYHREGIGELSKIGSQFFNILVGVQILLVMFAAPAVAAGSICVEKTRGTLHHVFVTDLSDREIIFGKLAVRMGTILSLVACGVPVLAITGLLGGVDYEDVAAAYLVTLGVALVATTLTTFFSVHVKKPQQALLPTYAILGLWTAAFPMMSYIDRPSTFTPGSPLHFHLLASPFSPLLMRLFPESRAFDLTDVDGTGLVNRLQSMALNHQAVFSAGSFLFVTSIVSLVIAISTVRRLRRVVIGQQDRPKTLEKPGFAAKLLGLLPGPPLDGNPVLWREWHRKKPTRWVGRLWTIYVLISAGASLFVLIEYMLNPVYSSFQGRSSATVVNGVQVAVGLLLLTISATSSLAEERDRGSLDVILTTPISTWTILWGKWWGSFAMVPRLAIFPLWISGGLALVTDRWPAPLLLAGLILSYSAALVSLGLLTAIWMPRLGRAIGLGVTIYLLISIGLPISASLLGRTTRSSQPIPAILYMTLHGTTRYSYPSNPDPPPWWTSDMLLLGSPYFGASEVTGWSGKMNYNNYQSGYDPTPYVFGEYVNYSVALGWIVIYATVSIVLMALCLLTFDRRLGRLVKPAPEWMKREIHLFPPRPSPLPRPNINSPRGTEIPLS